MFFSSLLIALAITWLTAVVDTVVESARTGADWIVMFGRPIYNPATFEIGVWIVCVLSASAMLAVVSALALTRGRRLRRRMAAELDTVERSTLREVGDAALTQLLPNRIAELQTSVDILTGQRDMLLAEIRDAQERQRAAKVVVVPDAPLGEATVEGGTVTQIGESRTPA